MARLHFPIDFRRARTPIRDSPAFPADCLPFFPAVLRPLSQGRRGILLAHHGYTWWMRYGQTKEKGHRGPPVQTGNPHTPVVQDEIKDPKRIQKRSATGFPKKEERAKANPKKNRQGFLPSATAPSQRAKACKRSRSNTNQCIWSRVSRTYKKRQKAATGRYAAKKPSPLRPYPPPMRRGLQNSEGIL